MKSIPSVATVVSALVLAALFPSETIAADESKPIIVRKIAFTDSTLREVVDYLSKRAPMLDPQKVGVNVVLAVPGATAAARVTYAATDVSLSEVLKKTAALAGCEVQVEPFAWVVRLKGAKPLPAIALGKFAAAEKIKRKLDTIIIPKVELRDTTIREAITFLERAWRQQDPDGGVNMVLKMDESGDAGPVPPAPGIPGLPPAKAPPAPAAPLPVAGGAGTKVTLSAQNIPWLEALRYAAGLAGLVVHIEPAAFVIAPE